MYPRNLKVKNMLQSMVILSSKYALALNQIVPHPRVGKEIIAKALIIHILVMI